MTNFLDFISQNILLLDGAMGTQIQGADLKVEEDYWGQENCSEILNLSRADFIRDVHKIGFTRCERRDYASPRRWPGKAGPIGCRFSPRPAPKPAPPSGPSS